MYKSNFVAFLLFGISFSYYIIYTTENPLYLHPVVLLSIMLITIVGVILFSDFHDPTGPVAKVLNFKLDEKLFTNHYATINNFCNSLHVEKQKPGLRLLFFLYRA